MRFAGDFFGVPLTTPAEDKSSVLVDYFPELKSVKKSTADGEQEGARSYGNTKAVTPFTGFKTMEKSGTNAPSQAFFGFKTFEQA